MSVRQRIAKLERDGGDGACVCVPESRRVRVQWPEDAPEHSPARAELICPQCGGELLFIEVTVEETGDLSQAPAARHEALGARAPPPTRRTRLKDSKGFGTNSRPPMRADGQGPEHSGPATSAAWSVGCSASPTGLDLVLESRRS